MLPWIIGLPIIAGIAILLLVVCGWLGGRLDKTCYKDLVSSDGVEDFST
jgi:hypothetical protein